MLLSARFLNAVAGVNIWQPADVAEFTECDPASVYFVLVDASLDRGCTPPGRRYIPATGATLQCAIEAIDDAKKITRYATNPYADDRSIWKLDFTTLDSIRGTAGIRLMLTEGVVVRTGYVKNGLIVYSKTCL